MRIRLSGDIGGMIIVAMVGLLFAGAVTAILGWIGRLFGDNHPGAKKVISILCAIVWVVCILLVVLDLLDIAPIIRNILFALLDA